MIRFSRTSLMCIAALVAMMSVAQAQTGTAQATSNPWRVGCNNQSTPNQLQCAMTQTIFQRETGKKIASVSISGKGSDLSMFLSLPHGLNLLAGVRIQVDEDGEISHQIQTADSSGSYTSFALTPRLIAALKAGNVLSLIVTNTDGRTIKLPMSLIGFSNAFALMGN